MENPQAMPRVFVPRRVECVPDKEARLQKLASGAFNPREVAFVETAIELPGECRGTAQVVAETPVHIEIAAHMDTPGLVVLDDNWDIGWQARLNGQPMPILITDHALRGVVVPQGNSKLEFRYASASFALGVKLFVLAAIVAVTWAVLIARRRVPGAASP
jgi:hypothetical protein